jgi:hypothetical protein
MIPSLSVFNVAAGIQPESWAMYSYSPGTKNLEWCQLETPAVPVRRVLHHPVQDVEDSASHWLGQDATKLTTKYPKQRKKTHSHVGKGESY